ncbi:hypothetical protein EVA_08144 [gut metagenome]|uniref:Uncharacterized protein n=1 Tax=gut metagenome TaxID=749906 RepID=J9CU55_9ZZZZ
MVILIIRVNSQRYSLRTMYVRNSASQKEKQNFSALQICRRPLGKVLTA